MDTNIQDIVERLKTNLQSKLPPPQTIQEWHAAGGSVPTQYRDKPHEWHAKVKHLAGGGAVDNTTPDMKDGGNVIDGPAFKRGGQVKMAGGGLLKALSAASKLINEAKAPINAAKEAQLAAELMGRPTQAEAIITPATAAQRAAAGRAAAKVIAASPPSRMSEALGNLNVEGKGKLSTTQADRTRVGGGNIGGAAFPAISEADPLYAGKVWGVMDKPIASRLTSLSDPNTVWSTMLGSATQLKTNPIVFDKLKKAFQGAVKEGKLSPELLDKYNQNLALTFGEGANVLDPSIWKQADTFEKRGALAEILMGTGKPPKEGGIALGGEKRGGSLIPGTDILKAETEPSLLHTEHGGESPTYAVGPRLFSLSGETEYRPDLHPGFPTLLGGKDYGYNIKPVPTEIALPDWHERFKLANPTRDAGYYDLSLGVKGEGLPSQDINEAYLKWLQSQGYKDGGAVHMKDGGRPPEQDTISATKPKHPSLEAISKALAGVQNAMASPFGYANPPGAMLGEFLGIPAMSKTAERLAYGEPLTSGRGQTLQMLPETTDAIMGALPMVGPAGRATKATTKFVAPKAGAMLEDYAAKTGLTLPIMMGEKSKTWNADKANKAIEMELAGKSPHEIWAATGTYRGPEGALRQEISDQPARFILKNKIASKAEDLEAQQEAIRESIKQSLGREKESKDLFPKEAIAARKSGREDISGIENELNKPYGLRSPERYGNLASIAYEHPELYAAYPELGNYVVTQGITDPNGFLGSLSGNMLDITKQGMRENPKSTAIHEMQHAIQGIENWMPGGNTAMAFSDPKAFNILNQMRQELRTPLPLEDFAKQAGYSSQEAAAAAYPDYVKYTQNPPPDRLRQNDIMAQTKAANQYYNRLGGEAESRMVQQRLEMNPQDRAEFFPMELAPTGYDVDPKSVLMRETFAQGGLARMQSNKGFR